MNDDNFWTGLFAGFGIGILITFYIGRIAEDQGQEEALNILSRCHKDELRIQDIKNDHWLCDNGKWTKQ